MVSCFVNGWPFALDIPGWNTNMRALSFQRGRRPCTESHSEDEARRENYHLNLVLRGKHKAQDWSYGEGVLFPSPVNY